MAEKQRMEAPTSMAGLVRYFEEEKSLIKLKPEHVAGTCLALVAIELILATIA